MLKTSFRIKDGFNEVFFFVSVFALTCVGIKRQITILMTILIALLCLSDKDFLLDFLLLNSTVWLAKPGILLSVQGHWKELCVRVCPCACGYAEGLESATLKPLCCFVLIFKERAQA